MLSKTKVKENHSNKQHGKQNMTMETLNNQFAESIRA